MTRHILAALLALPLLFAAATTANAGGCCGDKACCEDCKDC